MDFIMKAFFSFWFDSDLCARQHKSLSMVLPVLQILTI